MSHERVQQSRYVGFANDILKKLVDYEIGKPIENGREGVANAIKYYSLQDTARKERERDVQLIRSGHRVGEKSADYEKMAEVIRMEVVNKTIENPTDPFVVMFNFTQEVLKRAEKTFDFIDPKEFEAEFSQILSGAFKRYLEKNVYNQGESRPNEH